jgi:CubicO group peptidase (beta-lactamase class C family)
MTGEPLPSTDVPLPAQPPDVAWPTLRWEQGPQLTGDPAALAALLDPVFAAEETPELGSSLAFVAVQGGRIVAERYGPGHDAGSTFISWSTAKSVTHAAVGMLVQDGLLDPAAPAGVAEWSAPGDERGRITTDDLLAMRSGLHFVEDYVDDSLSDCLEMLWGSGADDVAGYAAAQPLEHPVGETFNYSSGTTNIVARMICDRLAGAAPGGGSLDATGREAVMRSFLRDRIFGPLGMSSATPKFDAAGTWVGSSYLFATARDFARFGLLYLRDGIWDGRRLLPEGWVDSARTIRSLDVDDGWWYGHHWWIRGDELGTFWANGYEGQMISCVPALDLVVVRLGKTPTELAPHRERFWRDVLDAFRT